MTASPTTSRRGRVRTRAGAAIRTLRGVRTVARLAVLAGGILVTAGVALVYPPAGLVVAGLGLLALGLDELREPPP